MTIADMMEHSKARIMAIPAHVGTLSILVLSTTGAFGLGMLAERDISHTQGGAGQVLVLDAPGFNVEMNGQAASTSPLPKAPEALVTGPIGVGYVASKSGSKYYLPSCSGVGRIREENKVWFVTVEDAVSAGYTPASNCPGL